MSEIRATTISDSAGTGPITLTAQAAVKVFFGYNFGTITYMTMTGGSFTDTTLNVSSHVDVGTGDDEYNLTNSMASARNTFLSGHLATNNTSCIHTDSTASVVRIKAADADSNTASTNGVSFGALLGDLA